MSVVDDRRFLYSTGQQARQWEAHFQRLFVELRTTAHEPIELVRASLYSPDTRTARRERLLVSLIDHPDSRATALLADSELYFGTERHRFIHRLARRRRQRQQQKHRVGSAAVA